MEQAETAGGQHGLLGPKDGCSLTPTDQDSEDPPVVHGGQSRFLPTQHRPEICGFHQTFWRTSLKNLMPSNAPDPLFDLMVFQSSKTYRRDAILLC